MDGDIVSLILLKEGDEGIIHHVLGGNGIIGRLASMGITSGVRIKVVRNIGGPVIITANGTRIAIGRRQAQQIAVNISRAGKGNAGSA